jgi:hypothetical protein
MALGAERIAGKGLSERVSSVKVPGCIETDSPRAAGISNRLSIASGESIFV